jgi:hypothetical protein
MVRTSSVGAAAILAAGLFLNGESRAADPTASCQYLAEACADEVGSFQEGYCIGYVSGVAASYTPPPGGRNFCAPSTVTRGQLEAVTAKWLKANPARWHLAPWRCVVEALAAVFPCPASGK